MRRFNPLFALAALAFASCASHPPSAPASAPPPSAPVSDAVPAPMSKPLLGEHGFDMAQLDKTVIPCDDFYDFAVGTWRKTTPLPPQYPRYGRFEELAERNRETLHKILEEAASANAPAGSATQKVGDFYAACMNEEAIEGQGINPIRADLDRVNAISSVADLQKTMIALQQRGVSVPFRFSGDNDFKNSKMIIASVGQGGLSLPDRDYYLRDDAKFKSTRDAYAVHLTRMLTLAGEEGPDAGIDAARILGLETKLAQAYMPRLEQRNPENVYHITPISDLRTMVPNVDWSAYMQSIGLADLKTVNVETPKYLTEVNRLMTDVPLEDWKAYLRWHVVDNAAPTLTKAFVNEDFEFRGKTLSGQKEQQDRWKRCVRATDATLGQILGQEYVRRTFTPEAKRKMNGLIDNLVAALRADIPTLQWMGPETKAAALEKLNAFSRRIGYPDKWIDYAKLDISRGSYAGDVMATRQFGFRRTVGRIGKPDDPNEWGFFTPPTVNASYNPARNDITFPAGILQPPFYDPNADDAYNYGGIGTVIGHEMTHGFDDQGAKFDAAGNLRDWWTPQDLKNFQGRAECIANQYSEFNVGPNLNINGKLVNGEAIADLGGATIALAAYEKSLEGKQRKTIDGFTPEQRFFLGFAQVWGENMSPEDATRRALTDPHAQGPFRVNATVSNMPAFHKAFDCHDSSKMVREVTKRCAIW